MASKKTVKKKKKTGATPRSARESGDGVFSPTEIIKVSEQAFYRLEQNGRVVVLSMMSDQIFHLDGMAAYIWLLLDGSRSYRQVLTSAKKAFAVKEAGFEDKIEKFLQSLISNQLAVVASEKTKPKIERKLNPHMFKGRLDTLKLEKPPDNDFPIVYAKSLSTTG